MLSWLYWVPVYKQYHSLDNNFIIGEIKLQKGIAQLAGPEEYTECFSAKG